MKCEHCGQEAQEGMAFCPACGTALQKEEPRPDPWEVQAEAFRTPVKTPDPEPAPVEPPHAPEPPKPYWQSNAGQGEAAPQQPPAYTYQGSATPPPQNPSSQYAYQGGPVGGGTRPENTTNNSMAVVGLVLGVVSLLINFFGIVGLAAVICSAMGLSQIKRTGQRGKGMAVAGLVLGILAILWGLVSLLILVGSFVSYSSGPRFY